MARLSRTQRQTLSLPPDAPRRQTQRAPPPPDALIKFTERLPRCAQTRARPHGRTCGAGLSARAGYAPTVIVRREGGRGCSRERVCDLAPRLLDASNRNRSMATGERRNCSLSSLCASGAQALVSVCPVDISTKES